MTAPLGLIAGDGRFPRELARAARAEGRKVVAIAFRGITDPGLESEVDELRWQALGELQAALDFLRERGALEAVMAGKVSKIHLAGGVEALRPDARAARLLGTLSDLNDDTILGAIADELEREGIRISPQAALVPNLLAGEGVLGRVDPTPSQWDDIRFGWPIAKAIAGLDIGQTVVVHDRAVLAVEALEGTDEAIRRAGKLGRPGLCIVKVAKPDQDPRFDLPAVGLETIECAAGAGAAVLAFEAGSTLVLDRPELIRRADEAEIALVGVAEREASGRETDERSNSTC